MTAQVVTITELDGDVKEFNGIQKIKWVWVSDSVTGAIVASATAGENPTTTKKYSGECLRLVTIPAAAAAAPTDNYDVTILDEDGYDVLGGGGMDRDTANTEQKAAANLGACLYTTLSLRVANCGTSKGGTVLLYLAGRA